MSVRRKEFSPQTKRLALDRSGGICECHLVPQLPTFRTGCGRKLTIGNTFFEHVIPCELGGGNEIDNAAALVRTCWRLKTDRYDLPIIAKVKRSIDRNFGIFRPKKRLPGSRIDPFKFTPGSTIPIDRKTGRVWQR